MLKKKLGIEAIEADWSLRKYFKIPSTLIIPPGCEYVGTGSFGFCKRLKRVEIPESVEFIGDCAFDSCEKATIIIINKSSKSDFKALGRLAFRYSTVSYVKEKTRT